ncbi:MAG: hypothetical protein NC452_16955 [Eubacterium sp.]|nr:hypothetical protein [Eubacterium sp.]
MNERIEQITPQEESRSERIARIVAKLPEIEQEKIYYMVKGVELAGANKGDSVNRAAV